MTISYYKGFPWQALWGKAAVSTSDSVHNQYITVSKGSCRQDLGPCACQSLICICSTGPDTFILRSVYTDPSDQDLQARLSVTLYWGKGKPWRHFFKFWLSTPYFPIPSPSSHLSPPSGRRVLGRGEGGSAQSSKTCTSVLHLILYQWPFLGGKWKGGWGVRPLSGFNLLLILLQSMIRGLIVTFIFGFFH